MLKLKRNRTTQLRWCSASREDVCAAVECMRDRSIPYTGPFVIKSGVAVFRVLNYILTVDELVSIYSCGLLTREGLSRFAQGLDTAKDRLTFQSKP
jgi:hypothetical protein